MSEIMALRSFAAAFSGDFRRAAELARTLRARGHRIEVQPEPYKMRRALELAAKQGARFALIVGGSRGMAGAVALVAWLVFF